MRLLGEHLDDVRDGEPPHLGRLIIAAPNFMALKNRRLILPGSALTIASPTPRISSSRSLSAWTPNTPTSS